VAKSIDGRIDSYIKTPEGYLLGRLAHLYTNLYGVQETQIIQTAIDKLKVRVVKASTFSDEDEKKLFKALRDKVGDTMRIKIEYLEEIPREINGKFRAVISQLTEEERGLN
jgi:phenylacetate-CoA ligase